MIDRRDFLVTSGLALGASLIPNLRGLRPANAAITPNMPAPNPYLAESVYPTSHFNPGATDSVLFAGPVRGRKLCADAVKTVSTVITSNPAIKKVGEETIAFASGAVGVLKLRLTGKAMEARNSLPILVSRPMRLRPPMKPFNRFSPSWTQRNVHVTKARSSRRSAQWAAWA